MTDEALCHPVGVSLGTGGGKVTATAEGGSHREGEGVLDSGCWMANVNTEQKARLVSLQRWADSGEATVGVSVVVAAYNSARWVDDLLAGIFKLEAPAGGLEVIFVDDGSTDGSADRVAALAAQSPWPFVLLALPRNCGRAQARNVGIAYARGEIVAITDADCVPHPQWLVRALAHFADPEVVMVQGQTLPVPGEPPPFFSRFMEVKVADGHYATCNMLYRRAILLAAGGFDPLTAEDGTWLGVWEDTDFAWRILAKQGQARFAPEAVIYHQIIPVTPLAWLAWAGHLGRRPRIAARYPAYRQHLYGGIWVDRLHLWLTLAAMGAVMGALASPLLGLVGLALMLPYLLLSWRRSGWTGKAPVVKWALQILFDLIGFATLLAQSVKWRSIVL